MKRFMIGNLKNGTVTVWIIKVTTAGKHKWFGSSIWGIPFCKRKHITGIRIYFLFGYLKIR